MAKRTLKSTWAQLEKFSNSYLKGNEEALEKIEDLCDKANEIEIASAVLTLFVKEHIADVAELVFKSGLEKKKIPSWHADYSPKTNIFKVHPLSVFKLYNEIQDYEVIEINDETTEEEFLHCRYVNFLIELGKLPSIYFFFLIVLQRVALTTGIANVEKRGGIVELAEGEAYHTLLWGFKELQKFVESQWGVHIRATYKITWFESEWITGR